MTPNGGDEFAASFAGLVLQYAGTDAVVAAIFDSLSGEERSGVVVSIVEPVVNLLTVVSVANQTDGWSCSLHAVQTDSVVREFLADGNDIMSLTKNVQNLLSIKYGKQDMVKARSNYSMELQTQLHNPAAVHTLSFINQSGFMRAVLRLNAVYGR